MIGELLPFLMFEDFLRMTTHTERLYTEAASLDIPSDQPGPVRSHSRGTTDFAGQQRVSGLQHCVRRPSRTLSFLPRLTISSLVSFSLACSVPSVPFKLSSTNLRRKPPQDLSASILYNYGYHGSLHLAHASVHPVSILLVEQAQLAPRQLDKLLLSLLGHQQRARAAQTPRGGDGLRL